MALQFLASYIFSSLTKKQLRTLFRLYLGLKGDALYVGVFDLESPRDNIREKDLVLKSKTLKIN